MVLYPAVPSFGLWLVALCACAGCTGPKLYIHNPDGHVVFVDGVRTEVDEIPFRYYGTTRWDAQPADTGPFGDWTLQPASLSVTTEPPLSGAWFPLDLPAEVLARLFRGRRDHTTVITLPPTTAQQLAETEQAGAQLAELRQRAAEARRSR